MPHNVWDDVPDWGGVGALRLDRAETGLGASVWELQPGASQFVYHFHHGNDELLLVLRGRPTCARRTAMRSSSRATPSTFRAAPPARTRS
jgi:hypothetical protein